MSFRFAPSYRFIVRKRDGAGKVQAYGLRTMTSCQAMLLTAGGVGTCDATFADPGQQLRGAVSNPAAVQTGPTPHAMDTVELWLQNRRGQWGPAWAGYVDESHYVWDPSQGELLHLLCTSPYKKWEVNHVSPSDSGVLALAYSENVAASSILTLSADRVGYPLSMLSFPDPGADSGPGFSTSLIQTAFTTPEESTWSAVLQALMANSGIEWFFDGLGRSTWRRTAFQTPTGYTPRPVVLDDILHADLSESDRGVVTSIEVRYAYTASVADTGKWNAPQAMTAQLGAGRHLVVYAPWLQSTAAAQALASILGEQYSANVLQGSVTIPADPLYAVGSIVAVPQLYRSNRGGTAHYYVASVSYSLDWAQQWVMTLGLTYGRSPAESYPYVGTARPYPTIQIEPTLNAYALSKLTALSFDPGSPAEVKTPFAVVADAGLTATQARADTSLLPLGSLIQVDTLDGAPLGKSSGGEYTVVAGQTGKTLGLLGTQQLLARVRFITVGTQQTPTSVGQAAGGTVQTGGTSGAKSNPGTGFSSGTAGSTAQPPEHPRTFAETVLRIALAQAPGKYVPGATGQLYGGQMAWDCSGLVYWAFITAGYSTHGFTDGGPNGEYYWFLAHGAKAIPVADALPGDLLFCQGALIGYTASQAGFGHVGWCLTRGPQGLIYGANNAADGLGSFVTAQFHDEVGHAVTLALDMSGVTPTS